ncbi:MAG: hypothetical protein A2854_04860 [Parcubacteria group bacterium RIFCSPHIGHO2_01_FULL_56_18]|nr:MAG: hypothetical protein A2854_04860 [Parcubacteria group bacterium RIFCSPHIGHO2_01_FULL_56_18]
MLKASMKWERIVLLVFFGNYLINEVAAGLSALVPLSEDGSGWGPYIVFTVIAAIVVGLLSWWFLKSSLRSSGLRAGLVFGVAGALVSIATTFVSGIFGTLFDTGSLAAVWEVLPNFLPFLWDVSTLVLIGYWVVPAALVGWFIERGAPRSATITP